MYVSFQHKIPIKLKHNCQGKFAHPSPGWVDCITPASRCGCWRPAACPSGRQRTWCASGGPQCCSGRRHGLTRPGNCGSHLVFPGWKSAQRHSLLSQPNSAQCEIRINRLLSSSSFSLSLKFLNSCLPVSSIPPQQNPYYTHTFINAVSHKKEGR